MVYDIVFYTIRNRHPLERFILSTQKPTQAKIVRSLELIRSYGPRIGMPHVKKINSKLYELRIRGQQEVRLLFSCSGKKIIFLHGFIKKSSKTPRPDIKIAENRLTAI